jgi:PAS domain S-box-containing protein
MNFYTGRIYKVPVYPIYSDNTGSPDISSLATPRSHYLSRNAQIFQGPLWSAIAHLPGMAFRRKTDDSLTIEYASEGCVDLTGYSPSDLTENKTVSFLQIINPADLASLKKTLASARKQKTPYHQKYRITTAGGTIKFVWEQGWWESGDSGEPLINEGFITDISTCKNAGRSMLPGMGCFSSVVDNSHEGILVIDDVYKLLYVNFEMCKVMERPREDLLGQDFRKFLPEESIQAVTDRYLRRQRGESVPDKYELTVTDGKGARKRLLISNAQIWHTAGKARSLIQLLDISDLRQDELAMGKDMLRSHIISEKIRDVIWTVDMRLRHTYLSPSVQYLLGYTPEELLNKDIGMTIAPESYGHVLGLLKGALACEDVHQDKEAPEKYRTLEIEMVRKDGSRVTVEVKPAFIRDPDGTPVEILGVSRDITLRKQAEDQLKSSRAFLLSLINSLDDPFFVKDEDRRWVMVNQKMCEFLGRPGNEVIGKYDHDLFSRERTDLLKERDELVLHSGKTIIAEDLVSWKGQETYISIKKSLYLDRHANKKYITGIIRDITPHKRLEQDMRNSHQNLEKRIAERTAELSLANEKLRLEIEVRKQTEAVLRSREIELGEMNTTLRVLLNQRDEYKIDMEEKIISNIKNSTHPYLEKLKASGLNEDQAAFLIKLEAELKNITPPPVKDLSPRYLGLTPAEMQVTSLIREGKSSKEIADHLNISLNTVLTHRYNIRRKAGLRKAKVNLRSFIQSME